MLVRNRGTGRHLHLTVVLPHSLEKVRHALYSPDNIGRMGRHPGFSLENFRIILVETASEGLLLGLSERGKIASAAFQRGIDRLETAGDLVTLRSQVILLERLYKAVVDIGILLFIKHVTCPVAGIGGDIEGLEPLRRSGEVPVRKIVEIIDSAVLFRILPKHGFHLLGTEVLLRCDREGEDKGRCGKSRA